jgi:hypothetical protein
MIAGFDDNGYLPPGIHPATLDEIAARFGESSEIRRVQMESVRWLVNLARRAGVSRLIVNGSFVTDVEEPNDVDCVLLIEPGFPTDSDAEAELNAGLPFVTLELVEQGFFELYVNYIYATDRRDVPKGMVEVLL